MNLDSAALASVQDDLTSFADMIAFLEEKQLDRYLGMLESHHSAQQDLK